MKSTWIEFNQRKNEVGQYFDFLEMINFANASIGNSSGATPTVIDDDLKKTLKANGFLLLYNLLESTMGNALESIYRNIKDCGACYDDLTEEMRKIILTNIRNQKIADLIKDLDSVSLDLLQCGFDPGAMFSGNLDARAIRKISQNHGISTEIKDPVARNGTSLLSIKTNRNSLAHGEVSFVECGRDQTVNDLIRLKEEVNAYLSSLLHNIEDFLNNGAFIR